MCSPSQLGKHDFNRQHRHVHGKWVPTSHTHTAKVCASALKSRSPGSTEQQGPLLGHPVALPLQLGPSPDLTSLQLRGTHLLKCNVQLIVGFLKTGPFPSLFQVSWLALKLWLTAWYLIPSYFHFEVCSHVMCLTHSLVKREDTGSDGVNWIFQKNRILGLNHFCTLRHRRVHFFINICLYK